MSTGGAAIDLNQRLGSSAFAFRGYNQTNLGRTAELLAVEAYRPTMQRRLHEASELCADTTGKPVDLLARVRREEEAGLDAYGEAISLVFAAEFAQLDLLREFHGVDYGACRMAFGYSLGELIAAAASGVFPVDAVLRVPLTFAEDCAEMAEACQMGIFFSRHSRLDEKLVLRLCEEVTAEDNGAVGVSAVLAPNTVLVIGQSDTLDRLKKRLNQAIDTPVLLRRHDGLWPPLHTPLVRRKNVPDRASVVIETIPRISETPRPQILSLVTGKPEYADDSGRETLRDWVDHPQRLWDVVCGVLSSDVRRIVHVGPCPNVIPATFRRLADNVAQQTLAWSLSGVGLRAVQRIANRPWLAALLPREGCLLRAPSVEHVILEDWLLENAPG